MHRLGTRPKRRGDVDMTQGNVAHHLVMFALPLLAGNIFQQFYNTVDTWVVGNFVSNEAFSAVGTVTPIVNMLIGSFMGLASGAGVVISQYYGAKQMERVKQAVHTSLVMTLVLGVIMTAAGILLTPFLLGLMKTPADVFPEATAYLTIYFSGVMGLMLYNMGAGILRAVGDARRPLYFLLFSAGVNTGLDLLFVAVFHWGIAGAAIATVAAQVLSAGLVLGVLTRSRGCYRIQWRGMRMHRGILRNIFVVGVPSALQLAITSFSNVFVQSYVNRFASSCMAGWAAYQKIDAFVILPMTTLSVTATTFVGQNYGAWKLDRCKKTLALSLLEDAIATGAFNPGELHENGVIDAVVEDARAWYGPQWDADKLVDAFARMHRRDTFPGYFDGSRRALAALKNMTSNLIGRFAGSVEQATRDTYGNEPLTRYNGDLVIPEETSYEIVVLKGIAVHFVMEPGEREPMHGEEQRIVGDLVDVFMADNPKPSSALENVFLDDWREAGSDGERLRVAIDQVASLTDTSALTLHSLLC